MFLFWVLLCHIPPNNSSSLHNFRSFSNPKPTAEEITTGADALAYGIQEHLKSRSILPSIILLRHDVYRYFFSDKGTTCDERGCVLLERKDFVKCYLPNYWDRIIDHIGDGVHVDFPIKLHAYLGSKKSHNGCKKVSISFFKLACSLT